MVSFLFGSRSFTGIPYGALWDVRAFIVGTTGIFLVGDCPGADAHFQTLLLEEDPERVTVGCAKYPRILMGNYRVVRVGERHSDKDKFMSDICLRAFALWDGFSPGTRNNIERLQKRSIPVTVFNSNKGYLEVC